MAASLRRTLVLLGSTGSKKTMPKITMPTAVKQKF